MHPTALLEAQTELVHRVLRFEHPADRVVADFFREQRALGARDRHLLADGVFALLRKLPLWRHLASSANGGRGEIERRLALLVWQGNAGVLNAALDEREREWLARCRAFDLGALPERLRHNLPDWLAVPLQARLGDEFWAWVEAVDAPAPLDLRVNALKADRDDVLERLRVAGFDAAATPHSPLGIRVVGKPALQKTEVFEQGLVEVQDEGSQLLALLTGARRGEMVVDFCAGAGGKTLALGAQMRNTGRLYAFDVSGHRLAALKPRLARSGLANVHPAQIAHERDDRVKRLAGKIDRVLVDAPCSGSGTLRRNPDLKWRQSADRVGRAGADAGGDPRRRCAPGEAGRSSRLCDLQRARERKARRWHANSTPRAASNSRACRPPTRCSGPMSPTPKTLVSGADLRLWTHRHATDGFFAALWERR